VQDTLLAPGLTTMTVTVHESPEAYAAYSAEIT
jgi:hypothetical protein